MCENLVWCRQCLTPVSVCDTGNHEATSIDYATQPTLYSGRIGFDGMKIYHIASFPSFIFRAVVAFWGPVRPWLQPSLRIFPQTFIIVANFPPREGKLTERSDVYDTVTTAPCLPTTSSHCLVTDKVHCINETVNTMFLSSRKLVFARLAINPARHQPGQQCTAPVSGAC